MVEKDDNYSCCSIRINPNSLGEGHIGPTLF